MSSDMSSIIEFIEQGRMSFRGNWMGVWNRAQRLKVGNYVLVSG